MTTLMRSNGSSTRSGLPSVLDDFLGRDWFNMPSLLGNLSSDSTMPAVNIRETGDSYLLEVAAPGMRKEDFNVELENDRLTISAERKSEMTEGEDERYTRREFSYQSFTRSFQLPERMVQAEKIDAQYKDGVLNITIPKSEEAKKKAPRRISIK